MKKLLFTIFVLLILSGCSTSDFNISGRTQDDWQIRGGDTLEPSDTTYNLQIPSLPSCDTIDTDSDGLFSCGTDASGTGTTISQLGQIPDVSTTTPMNYRDIIVYDTNSGEWVSTSTSFISALAGAGTVTSVNMSVPTGLSIAGNPITTSGTLALTFTGGYSIPLTASTTNGNTAYLWGDHSLAGYLNASAYYATTTHKNISSLPALSITESQISDLGTYLTAESDPVWSGVSANYLLISNAFTQAFASTTFQPIITAGTYDPYGQATSTLGSHTTTYNHANYNTAYGWGNHASAGYLLSINAFTQAMASTTFADKTLYVPYTGATAHLDLGLFNASTTQLTTTGSTYLATAGGNVGIGTTEPIYALDVLGTSNEKKLARFTSDDNDIVVIDDDGNIGVGTTSPAANIDVNVFGNACVRVGGTSGYDAGYTIYQDDNTHIASMYYDDSEELFRIGTWTAEPLLLSTNKTAGENIGLYIGTTGNVGIGTTSPDYKLTVYGTASTTALYANTLTIPTLANPAGSFLAVNATGQIIATTTPSGGGYSSLADLQAAVSNDFHNLGGTDANTTYTGGDFLTLTGTDFDVDTGAIADGASTILATADAIYDFVRTATSSLSYESGLTAGDGLTRTVNDFDCDTANSAAFGCLTAANWNTFNNKWDLASSTIPVNKGGTSSTTLSGILKGAGTGAVATAVNGTDYTLVVANPCTNQVITALTASGGSTCSSVSNAMLSNSTISGVALGSNLAALTNDATLNGSSYNGSGAISDWGLNLANPNTWTGLQQFNNASTTLLTSGRAWFNIASDYGEDGGVFINASVDAIGLHAHSSDGGASTKPILSIHGDNVLDKAIQVGMEGDTLRRLSITANGNLEFGPGGATARDARFYRSGVSEFTIDNNAGGNAKLTIIGNASTTLFSTEYASSTTYYGAGLQTCNSSTGKLTWSGGVFSCGTDTNTTYTAGDFITLTGTDFDVDTGAIADGATTVLATADAIYDFMRTSTSTLSSLYLSITGGTGTGVFDFGGATSFELPNGASPTVDTDGECAIDTTSGQFKCDLGATVSVIGNGFFYPSFTYATSTAWTATTTIPLGTAFIAETWDSVQCFTDVGTLNVSFYDGTNRMNLLNASTTVGTVTLSTNNTFTAAEKRYVDIGTPATAPTKVSCTIKKAITAD